MVADKRIEERFNRVEEDKPRSVCLRSHLRKTKICAYHLSGTCQYGRDCAFAHSCAELQATPDLSKTRLCKAFAEGHCVDRKCRFAHGEEDMRSTTLFYKRRLCIWNQKGKCRNGDACNFAHGSGELREQDIALAQAAGESGRATGATKRSRRRRQRATTELSEHNVGSSADGGMSSNGDSAESWEPMKVHQVGSGLGDHKMGMLPFTTARPYRLPGSQNFPSLSHDMFPFGWQFHEQSLQNSVGVMDQDTLKAGLDVLCAKISELALNCNQYSDGVISDLAWANNVGRPAPEVVNQAISA